MTEKDIAIRVMALAATFDDSDFELDEIGPSRDFIDTTLVQHSMSKDDVAVLVQRGKEAIRNSDVAKIKRIAEIGGTIFGELKGLLL